MKRLILPILLIVISTFLFAGNAYSNRQEIYSVDSMEYKAIRDLYISHGYALPSTSGPWPAADLYGHVKESLDEKARYSSSDMFCFDLKIDFNGEAYLHTNKDAFTSPDEYARRPGSFYSDYNKPTPLVSIPFETWIGQNVYGYTSLDLSTVRHVHSLTETIKDSDGNIIGYSYNPSYIMHNLVFIPPTAFSDFNMNFPYRAFASIGGSWWNIAIGRDKLSWGPGETGNFIIGDQIPYHNNARVSFFTKNFKYIFSISSFIHPMNYMKSYDNDGSLYYYYPEYRQDAPRDGLRMFISHRLEWRLFDKVNMALTEGIMYQNENGMLDPLVISPTAVFHNFYIRGNANSILSLEVDFSFLPHWNGYLELGIDELQMPGEQTKEGNAPGATGLLAGVKFSYPQKKGNIYGSFEGAMTTPYLYLRDDGESRNGDKYGNSFVVAFPEFVSDADDGKKLGTYTLQYVGYRYGGDAIVLNANTGYEEYGKWYAEGNILYLIHGAFDTLTRWSMNDPANTPTDSEGDAGSYDKNPANKEKNAVMHVIDISVEGGITPLHYFDIYGRCDFITAINKDNMKGNNQFDFQFTLGLKYSL